MSDWLKTLQPGSLVIVPGRYDRRDDRVAEVERLTATQIILAKFATRYRRTDGGEIGRGDFGRVWLKEPTPDRLCAIQRQRRIDRLNATDWSKLPDETIDAAHELLQTAALPEPGVTP